MHKAGFINILGNPNAGKSTLMNALVGEPISIVNAKVQTTRHRIMGMLNLPDAQLIFSDTPGIIKPAYKLQEGMMRFVSGALSDADILLLVSDVKEKKLNDESLISKLNDMEVPLFVLLNKIDTSNQQELDEAYAHWKNLLPKAEIILVSALHSFNLDVLLQKIIYLLPEHPPYFSKEDNEITDKTERFIMSEIIREKILQFYDKEIPYCSEVIVSEFKEKENLIAVRAEIIVERDSQKGIIIGHKGSALKKTGTEARKQAEIFFGKKFFLELHVKVDKDWRHNENKLKRYGYWQ